MFREQDRLPVYINNRNRLTFLLRLVEWLEKIEYVDITILDNSSTWPPLLEWYGKTKHKVIHLGANLGHHSLWEYVTAEKLQLPYCRPGDWFVYTDPDVAPINSCPLDVFEYMADVMLRLPQITKVGFGIEIGDLPDHYPLKADVQKWERQFWSNLLVPGVFNAPVDTTLALYNKTRIPRTDPNKYQSPHYWDDPCRAVRCAHPYVVRHYPWYIDPHNLNAEEWYFMSNASKHSTWTDALKQRLDVKSLIGGGCHGL